jgi:hypothetical protein
MPGTVGQNMLLSGWVRTRCGSAAGRQVLNDKLYIGALVAFPRAGMGNVAGQVLITRQEAPCLYLPLIYGGPERFSNH